MSQAQAVAETDRLPWLPDEPPPTKRRGSRALAVSAAVAAAVVLAAAYWFGSHAIEQSPAPTQPAPQASPVAIEQPHIAPPQQLPPQPEVALQPPPQVTPAPAPRVSIARPHGRRAAAHHPARETAPTEAAAETQTESTTAKTAAEQPTKPVKAPLKLWPATQSQGAEGRIVRIGAFGSRDQAKLGWRYMVRAYPAVAHLPATVVGVRNSHGQHFYRCQIGTTSQAHSEVLCQRMDRIHFSCAVVGLPWKPNGVER